MRPSILQKLGAIVARLFPCSSLKGHCLQRFQMKQDEKSKHQLHIQGGWEGVSGSIGTLAWLWCLGRRWSRSSWNPPVQAQEGQQRGLEYIKDKLIVLCDKPNVSVDGRE